MIVLAGDIGGTNARLALFEEARVIERVVVPTGALRGLDEAVEPLLARVGVRPAAGCIAVAGPVTAGAARITNGGLELDAARLGRRLGFPLRLVNDFHAQAAAISAYGPDDVVKVGGGAGIAGEPMAVLGPGTGLGEAYVVPLPGGERRIVSTEGGHTRFAPRDERDIDVLRALWEQHPDHVSVERILSGPGLVALYDALRGATPRHPEMDAGDAAAVVTRHGLDGGCAECAAALEVFVGVLGDEAANLALKTGARGGVYVTGGIAPRLIDRLRAGAFHAAFLDKGRFRGWLEAVPLFVVVHPEPGLLGACTEACALATSPPRAWANAS